MQVIALILVIFFMFAYMGVLLFGKVQRGCGSLLLLLGMVWSLIGFCHLHLQLCIKQKPPDLLLLPVFAAV